MNGVTNLSTGPKWCCGRGIVNGEEALIASPGYGSCYASPAPATHQYARIPEGWTLVETETEYVALCDCEGCHRPLIWGRIPTNAKVAVYLTLP